MQDDSDLDYGSRKKKRSLKSSRARRFMFPTFTFLQMKDMSVLKVIFRDANQKAPLTSRHVVTGDSREVIQGQDGIFQLCPLIFKTQKLIATTLVQWSDFHWRRKCHAFASPNSRWPKAIVSTKSGLGPCKGSKELGLSEGHTRR